MYTAALDGVRASWIVRPDGSVTGVQFNGGVSGRDFEQAQLQQLNAAQFQAQVRNKRILQQADQQVSLQNGTLISKINGRTVTGSLVTGTTRF
jgi:ATP-dependent DNA ligase